MRDISDSDRDRRSAARTPLHERRHPDDVARDRDDPMTRDDDLGATDVERGSRLTDDDYREIRPAGEEADPDHRPLGAGAVRDERALEDLREGDRPSGDLQDRELASREARDRDLASRDTRDRDVASGDTWDRDLASGDTERSHAPLFPSEDSNQFRERWMQIQTRFVDEPRQSVEQADDLVEEVTERLTSVFARNRDELERQWTAGDEVSTEDLRRALQRYRSFFERLLSM